MKIRQIAKEDLPEIARLAYRIMGPHDAKKALEDIGETLERKKDSPFKFDDFFVVQIENHIVATGGTWALRHDPFISRLDWFMVDPQQQRKGLGTILLKKIQESLKKKKVKLLLAETSSGKAYKAAVGFWEKNDFKEIAKIPNYWEDGSACLYFVKRL